MHKILTAIFAFALSTLALSATAASLANVKLGKEVIDREVVEETSTYGLGESAYLWMRVVDSAGETVTVNWSIDDQSFEVPLSIGSDSWRTWSSKKLHIPGTWTVSVTDSTGTTLHETTLTVQ